MSSVTLETAIGVCRLVELIAVKNGYHVALAGGCITKQPPRKDMEVVLYKRNGADWNEKQMLFDLATAGFITQATNHGYEGKAGKKIIVTDHHGIKVDFFLPL